MTDKHIQVPHEVLTRSEVVLAVFQDRMYFAEEIIL